MWLHSLKVAQLLRSAACLHTNKSRSYLNHLVLMAKEETVLPGMIDKLIEIGSCYGMEMNVEKTKVMRISVTIMIDQKTGECGMF